MVEINLLPWRDEKIKHERKMMRVCILSGTMLAFLILSIAHFYLSNLLVVQAHRVQLMQSALLVYTAKNNPPASEGLKKEGGVDDEIVSPLVLLTLLNAATASTVYGICYSSLIRDGKDVKFSGRAWSLPGVALALQHFKKDALFNAMTIAQIKGNASQQGLHFLLTAKI
jgi:hypothetical protein